MRWIIRFLLLSMVLTSCGRGGGTKPPEETPACRLTPSQLDFGNVQVGTTKDLTFTIKNTGSGTLTGSVTRSGDAYTLPSGGGSYSLAADQEKTVTVRFAPTVTGAKFCTVSLGAAACGSMECSGTGTEPPPATGSCCTPAGTCTVTTLAACSDAWTAGGACAPNPCAQPPSCQWTPPQLDFGSVQVGSTKDLTFTIKNTGGGTLVTSVTGSCDAFPIQSGGGSHALAAGQETTVTVRFAPTSAGSQVCTIDLGAPACGSMGCNGTGTEPPPATGSCCAPAGTCTVATQAACSGAWTTGGVCTPNPCPQPPATGSCCAPAGTCTVTTQASCTGTWTAGGVCTPNPCPQPPACQLAPAQLEFGSVEVGSTKDLTFTIRNTGGGTLAGSVTENCDAYSIQEGGGSYTLAAGGEMTVTVRFAPTSASLQACAIDLGAAACGSMSCSGTGTLEPPACELVPPQLDFGTVPVRQTKDLSFTIRNTGHATLAGTVTESCAAYSILFGGGDYALATGEEWTVTVRFAPTSDGMYSCEVSLGTTPCASMGCTGTGTEPPPACQVTPPVLAFGDVQIGQTKEMTFTIENTGGGTLTGNVTESGDACSVPSGGGPYTLATGEEKTVIVRFAPAGVGSLVCMVDLGTAACEPVECSGAGTEQPPPCLLTPSQLDFGSVEIGQTKDLIFSIRNTGIRTLTGNVAEGCEPYTIQLGGGAYSLAVGEERSVTVRFAPTVTGSQSCTVNLGATACGSMGCRGTGTAPPPVNGACCAPAGTCTVTTQAACSGTWTTGGVCTPNPCPQPPATGSCCAPAGTCTVTTQAACTDTWTTGGVCAPNPCPSPTTTGSCCAPVGTCAVTTQAACTSGTWTTGGVCTPNTCPPPPPTGSCCAPAGTCTVTTQAACTDAWTTGGVCTPNTCPQPPPTGSCCAPAGTCTVTTQAACTATWTTGGVCTPNTCPQPPPTGSCCAPGGTCTVTTQAACTATWTTGGVCTPNTCPQPPPTGSCCAAAGTCTVTTQAACTDTWTTGGVCTPNPCPLPPACQLTPPALDFGSVNAGSTKDLTFTIKNTGGGSLTGSVAESCNAYSIQSGGGTYALSANQETTVTVRFAPAGAGSQVCTIDLGSAVCGTVSCTGAGQSVVPSLTMVVIPAGTFTMGSPPSEPGRSTCETQHQVTLTKAFYVSVHEVTQSEWQTVMGWNDSHSPGVNHPVESVTWYDAVSYCNQRSALDGFSSAYTITSPTYDGNHIVSATVTWNQAAEGYRLLTEAEWEYACRAMSTSAFCNGGITNPECWPLDPNLDQVGWYCGVTSHSTYDVGGKAANAWGLKDMHGNVNEWCWDWFECSYGGDATDPSGPATSGPNGVHRVKRGGWRASPASGCRSATRGFMSPGQTEGYDTGVRVSRTVPEPPPVCQLTPSQLDFGRVGVGQTMDVSFVIRNAGGRVLTGNVTEGCDAYSIQAGGGAYSLSSGQQKAVTVRFAPTVQGAQPCTVSLGAVQCAAVACSGTGTPPAICQLTPPQLDFGNVQIYQTKDLTFTIKNTGDGILTGSVNANCPRFFIVSGEGSYSLAANEEKAVTVRFTPIHVGMQTCTVSLGGTICGSMACSGTGTEPPPVCALYYPNLEFGDVQIGQTKDLTFTIKNTGGGTLTGSATESCDAYSVSAGGESYSLGANQEKTVQIRFAPTVIGSQPCTVSPGAPACGSVACTGTGTEPPSCQLTPPTLDFGALWTGEMKDLSFTIKNVGAGLLVGSVSDCSSPFFVQSGGGSYSLAANEERNVTVRFVSAGGGGTAYSCNLSLGSELCGLMACSGTSVSPPECLVTPSSLDFGSVPIGSTKELSFTLKNMTSMPWICTVNPSCTYYSIVSGGGTFPTDPGAERTVVVSFAPLAAGTHTCTIDFGGWCEVLPCTGQGGAR